MWLWQGYAGAQSPSPPRIQEGTGVTGGPPSASGESLPKLYEEVKKGFSFIFKTLAYGNSQKRPDDGPSGEAAYYIPRYGAAIGLRPDFSQDFRALHLVLKPRLYSQWQRWEDGPDKGKNDYQTDIFINEWVARLQLPRDIFASYGRENLQWGPAFFISPSNPFFADNGQANPKREIAGMDFARGLWIMSPDFTGSVIANTGRGQQAFFSEFKRVYAVKADYTAFKKYGTLILSEREGEGLRLGGFAGSTISDAMLLYGEGAVFKGNELYHLKKDFEKEIPELSRLRNLDDGLQTLVLVGSSYTLEAGPTFSVEYVYNSAGFSDNDAELAYRIIGLSDSTRPPQSVAISSDMTSGKSLGPNYKVFRKNYTMLQYSQSQIFRKIDLALRYAYNFDSSSSQVVGMSSYYAGDHTQLFFVGNKGLGPKDGEFRAIVDWSLMFGIEYTF